MSHEALLSVREVSRNLQIQEQTSLPTICVACYFFAGAVGRDGGQTLFADSQWVSGDWGHREHSWLAQQSVTVQLTPTATGLALKSWHLSSQPV